MSSYSDHLRAHLTAYKLERLGVTELGVWRNNSQPYGHILPESLQKLNIVETIRREFWKYFEANKATLSLHTDFHHLNSSQAFAFNLFFPWMASSKAQAEFLAALGLGHRTIKHWRFEHMPDQFERTSVDYFAEFEDGGRLFIEVKLTEEHFGTAKDDESHRTKLRDTYAGRLTDKVTGDALEPATFFLNYQLLRNVSHLDLTRQDTLLLLLPRANTFTWLQGQEFREKYLKAHCQGAVLLVTAEDLVRALAKTPEADLKASVRLLAEKYLPDVCLEEADGV